VILDELDNSEDTLVFDNINPVFNLNPFRSFSSLFDVRCCFTLACVYTQRPDIIRHTFPSTDEYLVSVLSLSSRLSLL